MSWLRRLSRDRTSKQEPQDYDPDHNAATYRPTTSHQANQNQRRVSASKDSQFPSDSSKGGDDAAMLRNSMPTHGSSAQYDHPGGYMARANASSDAVNMHSSPRNSAGRQLTDNGASNTNMRGSAPARDVKPNMNDLNLTSAYEPTPDPLQRAFNEALKPYIEQINALKADVESAHQTIASLSSENQQLNSERASLHAWIDKRGLRPDLPPGLAASFPQSSVAASTLSTQLDRKMTMLNYSLHHLADSAPEPLPASTVTSTLATLLPPVQHLASLQNGGPSFAFETLIKLAGNLNSHSTGEETDYDRQQIADFYDRLDEAMAGVVGRRFQARGEGLEDWDVQKDVKRLDKTGAFLRKEMGVSNYFVRSLDLMRDALHGGMFMGGQGAGSQQGVSGGGGGGGGAHAGMYNDGR